MSGTWGKKIELSIFGESHGKAIGIVMSGLPSGLELDMDFIQSQMQRRRGGMDLMSTPRREEDKVEIVSGLFEGKTTGTPLCGIIANGDTKSADYDKIKHYARPSHADYTGSIRYGGFQDYRGGGHFSGRITAPLVFAGSIAKLILKSKGITVGGHILSIGTITEEYLNPVTVTGEFLEQITQKIFPVIDDAIGRKMQEEILAARADLDSVGGVVELGITGLPAGIGDPFFDSVESVLSHIIFSVPAVKGLEFGAGFSIARQRGSEANDPIYYDGEVKTETNNNGGILGGITNGMPIILRAAFKPTPSISKEQKTIDMDRLENVTYAIQGRHDPCIAKRGVVVLESAAALGILDLL